MYNKSANLTINSILSHTLSPHKTQQADVHIPTHTLQKSFYLHQINHCHDRTFHSPDHKHTETHLVQGVSKGDQVWTCYFYYALLNGITQNQKHPYIDTVLVKSVKMNNGYIPMLNTEISSCHIFPKRTEFYSLCNLYVEQ